MFVSALLLKIVLSFYMVVNAAVGGCSCHLEAQYRYCVFLHSYMRGTALIFLHFDVYVRQWSNNCGREDFKVLEDFPSTPVMMSPTLALNVPSNTH